MCKRVGKDFLADAYRLCLTFDEECALLCGKTGHCSCRLMPAITRVTACVKAFQAGGIRAEGYVYPSPASRFGARDDATSLCETISLGSIGDALAVDASPCRGRSERNGMHADRYAEEANEAGSPYFDHFDRQSHPSHRESPQRRRLALGRRNAGGQGGAKRFRAESPVAETDVFCPAVLRSGHEERAAADDVYTAMEDDQIGGNAKGYADGEGGGWAAEAPDVASGTRLPPPTCLEFESICGPQSFDGDTRAKQYRTGGGRRRKGNGSRDALIRARDSGKEDWLRYLPGVAVEMSPAKQGKGDAGVAEGGNERRLSRLFDFAFTDNGRHQSVGGQIAKNARCRIDGGNLSGGGGGDARKSFPIGRRGAFSLDQESLHTRSLSPRSSRDTVSAGTEKQTLVGVTVRRPPSPQFNFMGEEASPNAPEPSSPGHQDLPSAQHRAVDGTGCVHDGDQGAGGVEQQAVRSSSLDRIERPDEDAAAPITRVSAADTTARRVERSPRSTSGRVTPSLGADAVPTPPLATKRRRPETWSATGASIPRDSSSLSLTAPRPAATVDDHSEGARQQRPSTGSRARAFGEGDGVCLGDGWLGWTRGHRRVRRGWWGVEDSATTPAGDDTPDAEVADGTSSVGAAGVIGVGARNTSCHTIGTDKAMSDVDSTGGATRSSEYERRGGEDDALTGSLEAERLQRAPRSGVTQDTEINARIKDGCQPPSEVYHVGEEEHGVSNVDAMLTAQLSNSEGDSGGGCNGLHGGFENGASSAKDLRRGPIPLHPVPMRAADAALAYDRDVIGGDGVADGVGWLESETGADFDEHVLPAEACDRCARIFCLEPIFVVCLVSGCWELYEVVGVVRSDVSYCRWKRCAAETCKLAKYLHTVSCVACCAPHCK